MFDQQNCTLKEFSQFILDASFDYEQYKNKNSQSIKNDYEILKKLSIEQIYLAYNAHRQNPDTGMYPPTPAHIMKYFRDNILTTDEIIAAARLKKTPIGLLAYIHIGSWDFAMSPTQPMSALQSSVCFPW